jgi:hypothetical protein
MHYAIQSIPPMDAQSLIQPFQQTFNNTVVGVFAIELFGLLGIPILLLVSFHR